MKILKSGLAAVIFCLCNFMAIPAYAQDLQKLSWHGYFSWNYENDTKASPNPNSAFDAAALALIPRFILSDEIDIYSQIVFEHAPFHDVSGSRRFDERSSGEIVLHDIYLTYALSDYMKIRMGKFATPFGFWNALQYAAPAYVTIKQPGRDSFYNRGKTPDTDSNLYGRYSQGAWLLGEKGRFSYDLYASNGKTSSRPHLDDSEHKAFGGRLGFGIPVGSINVKIIYSRYEDSFKIQSVNSTTFEVSTSANFVNQNTNAVSVECTGENIGITSEIAYSKRDTVRINAFYAMAKYNLGEKWIPFLQYQQYEPDKDIADDKTDCYSYGCAYQVLSLQTLLKLEADYLKTEKQEGYYRYILGLAAAF